MGRDTARYALSTEWEHERRRLEVLEETPDPATITRLEALGVGAGAR